MANGYPVRVHLKFPNPWNVHEITQGGIAIPVEGVIIENEDQMRLIANQKLAPYLRFDHSISEQASVAPNPTADAKFESMTKNQLIAYIVQTFEGQDESKLNSYSKQDLIWTANELLLKK